MNINQLIQHNIFKRQLSNTSYYFNPVLSTIHLFMRGRMRIIALPTRYIFANTSCLSLYNANGKSMKLFLRSLYSSFLDMYSFRLKIRGLGYRWRTITDNFHYIFFNYTNYFYFSNPVDILIHIYKKRMLITSYDWFKLRLLVCNIILLRRIGPYTLFGIKWARAILILKKTGKKL